jgi:mannosyltransferase OCH1-like enzyme
MIPPTLNYVWIADKRPLGPLELAVIEQGVKISGCQVVLHTDKHVDISGVRIKLRQFPTTINGKEAKHIEHRADVARFYIALDHGGFFSDTDMWLFEPIVNMCKYESVFAFQNKAYKTVAISFFGCFPGNKIIEDSLESYLQKYPGKNYWSLASFRNLVPNFLENISEETLILPQRAFFSVRMKDPNFFTNPEEKKRNFNGCVGLHLWSHKIDSGNIVLNKLRNA